MDNKATDQPATKTLEVKDVAQNATKLSAVAGVAPKIMTSAVRHSNGKRTFELNFRKGNRKPETKVFEMDCDLPDAITRARLHCERMGYRFCGVFPFIVDLDIQEASRNDEIYSEPFAQ